MAKGYGRMGGMGGGMNMNMIKQAQKMQQDMLRMQQELQEKEYRAAAGGGVAAVELCRKQCHHSGGDAPGDQSGKPGGNQFEHRELRFLFAYCHCRHPDRKTAGTVPAGESERNKNIWQKLISGSFYTFDTAGDILCGEFAFSEGNPRQKA